MILLWFLGPTRLKNMKSIKTLHKSPQLIILINCYKQIFLFVVGSGRQQTKKQFLKHVMMNFNQTISDYSMGFAKIILLLLPLRFPALLVSLLLGSHPPVDQTWCEHDSLFVKTPVQTASCCQNVSNVTRHQDDDNLCAQLRDETDYKTETCGINMHHRVTFQ